MMPCMGEKKTLGLQIDTESELYKDFEEYQQRRGFTSRSETLRHLMRQEFEDEDEPVGVAAAVSKIAGEQLTEQLGVLSRYVIAMAVSLMAVDFGIPGGVFWFVPVVFFGFLVFTTTLGAAVGFAEVLDVNSTVPSRSSTTAEDSEVEA